MAEQVADVAPAGLDRARIGFAQQGLELGEDLFDWIEIGRVAGQEEQLGAGSADQAAHGFTLVAAEIVHDDDVTGVEGRHEELFDIGAETGAVNRSVDDAGRRDAVVAQCSPWFAPDSALEGAGFEPLVPRDEDDDSRSNFPARFLRRGTVLSFRQRNLADQST